MPFFSQQVGAFAQAVEQLDAPTASPLQGSNRPPPDFDDQEQVEAETLSEVEIRLVKANYYRAILDQPLFGADDSDAAFEVEREFRDFALERLRILLGMQAEKAPEEKAFTEDQEDVLREWADRLMAKPQLLGVVPSNQPQVSMTTVRPVSQQSPPRPIKPTVNQVSVATQTVPRKRGRPPGTGKNQRLQQSQALDTQPSQTHGLSQSEIDAGMKIDAEGKYFEQNGHDQVTGQPKIIKMRVGGVQVPVNDPNYKPMPSPDSDISMMREQQEAGMMHNKAINLHPKMGEILNHFMSKE